jgi:uncharacterized glyoxalase superfamily protein PhnB
MNNMEALRKKMRILADRVICRGLRYASSRHAAQPRHYPGYFPQTGSSLMVTNRSVPADTVLPHLTYRDVAVASAWLAATFGFTEHYRYGPPSAPSGAQMYLDNAWVMLDVADPGQKTPAELGYGTQSLTVFVANVKAHYEKAKSAGAMIVEDLHETIYGERQYGARDLDGHHWLFSAHARDVSPAEWGATITAQPPQSQPENG